MQVALEVLGVKPAELEVATRIMDALCTLKGGRASATAIQAISTSEHLPIRTGDAALLLNRLRDCVRVTRTDRRELFSCTYADLRTAAENALVKRKEEILERTPALADRAAVTASLARACIGDARHREAILASLAELEQIDRKLDELRAFDQFV